MGKPKRDAGEPDARHRLIEALWELLENHRLREVTVTMVVAQASYNRGTFYYHFSDIDALMGTAIETELFERSGLVGSIFSLVSKGDESLPISVIGSQSGHRLALAMRQGGFEVVQTRVCSAIKDMWRTVLCGTGRDLEPASCALIEFSVSGMLGIIAYCGRLEMEGKGLTLPRGIFVGFSGVMLEQISAIQGIPQQEILERLEMLDAFGRISQGYQRFSA